MGIGETCLPSPWMTEVRPKHLPSFFLTEVLQSHLYYPANNTLESFQFCWSLNIIDTLKNAVIISFLVFHLLRVKRAGVYHAPFGERLHAKLCCVR